MEREGSLQERCAAMDTVITFGLFFAALLFSLYQDISILYPLLLGLIGFTAVSLRRGYALPDLLRMMYGGSKKALLVVKIFVFIGAITAAWRACGTIPFIVYHSIALMNPSYFLPSAFLLCCFVSFLLGTSFGTVGTIGVILMVLAKSGHVDVSTAAGAIIAGAFFGDRFSPMSSSASLVAALTNTDLYDNLKNMWRSSLLPLALSVAAYLFLSFRHPFAAYDNPIGPEIATAFNLHPVTVLPAVIILVLSLFRVDVKRSMGVSVLAAIAIGVFIQHQPLLEMLAHITFGYRTEQTGFFASIIQGGGLSSMVKVSAIVFLSSAYSGIFEGTGLLKDIETFFLNLSDKISVYPAMLLASLSTAAFSCNQTLAVMLTQQLTVKMYKKRKLTDGQLALDLENTVIVLSALIPWNIAGAVPAAALGADAGFIPYAFYLYLLPLVAVLSTRRA